jgi:hypothetical protein
MWDCSGPAIQVDRNASDAPRTARKWKPASLHKKRGVAAALMN